ncbi:MAG: hypothetical protein H0T39_08615 [Actinobacteria bacterium]|nr:hypothetical protein [Actinomycetota bacterium]
MARLTLPELRVYRAWACRLGAGRALATLEEAEAFVHERGLVTLTQSCALPSLHAAIQEEPLEARGRGFAAYPRTKWWWGGALAQRPGVLWLKILRGKGLFLSGRMASLVDPLCRAELAAADEGAHGEPARRLAEHLAAAGPSLLDDLRAELGLEPAALRAARTRLERLGAVVAKPIVLESHRHTSELRRWSGVAVSSDGRDAALVRLVEAGLRAAVLTPEREVHTWFSWPVPPEAVDRLLAEGRAVRLGDLLAARTAPTDEGFDSVKIV